MEATNSADLDGARIELGEAMTALSEALQQRDDALQQLADTTATLERVEHNHETVIADEIDGAWEKQFARRDRFAAAALQGLLAGDDIENQYTNDQAVRQAWALADSMLAADSQGDEETGEKWEAKPDHCRADLGKTCYDMGAGVDCEDCRYSGLHETEKLCPLTTGGECPRDGRLGFQDVSDCDPCELDPIECEHCHRDNSPVNRTLMDDESTMWLCGNCIEERDDNRAAKANPSIPEHHDDSGNCRKCAAEEAAWAIRGVHCDASLIEYVGQGCVKGRTGGCEGCKHWSDADVAPASEERMRCACGFDGKLMRDFNRDQDDPQCKTCFHRDHPKIAGFLVQGPK